MASRLKKLQDRDAAIVSEMKAISEKLSTDNRVEMTEEETNKFNALKTEANNVKTQLGYENDILAAEKRLAEVKNPNELSLQQQEDLAGNKPQKGLVPAEAKRHRNLKSFTGPDAGERAYRSGMFLAAAVFGDERARLWCQDAGMQMLAQSETVNSAGGYLVPIELSSAIIDLREQYGVFRRNAKHYPMNSDTLIVPRRLTGLTAYFVSDGVATTESQKSWDSVELVARELAVLVRYPITLAEDAIINMADDLTGEIAYQFALKEDQCGFLGDGTSTYGGITGVTVKIDDAAHANGVTTNGATTGGVKIAAAGGTGMGTMVLADYENLMGLLPQYASFGAKWYMSRAAFAAGPQRLMDAGGGNTNVTLGAGSGLNFLGYPVEITQVMNSTLGTDASKIKVLFGNLAMAAAMGTRRDITISSSKDRYFEFRQLAIQGVERFDINVHDLGDGTTAGPIVALKSSAT